MGTLVFIPLSTWRINFINYTCILGISEKHTYLLGMSQKHTCLFGMSQKHTYAPIQPIPIEYYEFVTWFITQPYILNLWMLRLVGFVNPICDSNRSCCLVWSTPNIRLKSAVIPDLIAYNFPLENRHQSMAVSLKPGMILYLNSRQYNLAPVNMNPIVF